MNDKRELGIASTVPEVQSLSRWPEFVIVAFALVALLAAEWVLTSVIPGTNYSQGDGKVAQAVILTTLKYGGIFNVTNINPVQGVGSQLLPLNVWVNPAYWPFAISETPVALDVSAMVSLGILALGCYIMARCFDVPVLPSIVAAQSVIVLFAPLARIMLLFYQVFWINPGTATVYASQLVALGILGRIEPGRIANVVFATGGIFALLLYSLSCDPLWCMIGGIGLLGAFAAVTLSPLRIQPILLRCAALGCCLALLVASGAIAYVYTLSQYTARVWFSDVLYYVPQRIRFLASIVLIYPRTLVDYYGICAPGWLFGLLLARGRTRHLVFAGFASFVIFAAYASAFLLSSKWWLPLPIYVEHSLFPLFTIAAVAGYWSALHWAKMSVLFALAKARRGIATVLRIDRRISATSPHASGIHHTPHRSLARWLATLLFTLSIPAAATIYGARGGAFATLPDFYEPPPDVPELMHYFEDAIGLRVGGEFRGAAMFVAPNDPILVSLPTHGVPAINEYSQMITPQAMYLASLQSAVSPDDLNYFHPWIDGGGSLEVLVKTLRALGVRYVALYARLATWDEKGIPVATFPRRAYNAASSTFPKEAGDYVIYEFPNPNLGNYSPTEVVTARSAAEFAAAIRAPDFDFTKQVVLSRPINKPLVPAHDMRLSLIRGGLHVSGSSDGTSLIVLPQQFSNCLSARDARVRLVRADLMLTGMVFSGDVDTDIFFDYGIFSPWCRFGDLRDLKSLDLKIK